MNFRLKAALLSAGACLYGLSAAFAQTVIQNVTYSSSQPTIYDATSITAAGSSTTVTVNSGVSITYQSLGTIDLLPGFHAASGSAFHAFIATGGGSPTAVTFSISPSTFTYDGTSHGPTISVDHTSVTYDHSGILSATNAGTYTFSLSAISPYSGNQTFSWTIAKASQSTVSITPTSPSTGTGQSITFSATGGLGSGAYTWSDLASGMGSIMEVNFSSAGSNQHVTVVRAADDNYNASSPATATINVYSTTPDSSGNPVTQLKLLTPVQR